MLGLDLSNDKTAIENAYEHHITSYGQLGAFEMKWNESSLTENVEKCAHFKSTIAI